MSDLVGNPEDRFSRVAAHTFCTTRHMNQNHNDALSSEYLRCSVTVSENVRGIERRCRISADR